MSDGVNGGKRRYRAPGRAAQAAQTRRLVLSAARDLFGRQGYAGTTVAQIATAAGVAVDTVYATVGPKATLLRELVETALSGADEPVAGPDRNYVQAMRRVPTAGEKLLIYAHAIVGIQQRLAPVFLALRDAAPTDPACAQLWQEISERRARNMRLLAADLRTTGELRSDLSDGEVADIIWTMNAAEYWVLLVVQRGWTPDRFGSWLADAWQRLLLGP